MRFLLPILSLLVALALPPAVKASDILDEWGIIPSTGAAPGYVPDAVCGECHSDKAESFKAMGMAKSFYRPSADKVIEDFDNNHFFHAPTGRHYEMELLGDDYLFRRYQLNAAGERIHQIEVKVDWILGSGHHTRVYLYRATSGELFQLPLAWYSQGGGKWEMAPGFEFADHLGLNRTVRMRCMACHNALPQVPEGSDRPGMPELFPAELPEGIGCQRCHGPGARHVELALGGEVELEEIHAAIVQPSVAVTPQLRLGRGVYSFRPGQSLSDYKSFLDIDDALRLREDRFDINHHPYRLEQSACFTQSEGKLGCLTCHDPHVKITPAERPAHYRAACLSCHDTDAQGLPEMASGWAHPDLDPDADCTTCHMPERRTQDVIHVTMTDHRIVRDPGPLSALTQPMAKRQAEVTGVSLLDRTYGLDQAEALLAKANGVLEYEGYNADYAAEAMEKVMRSGRVQQYEPWLSLSRAFFKQGDFAKAQEAAETGLAIAPEIARLRMQRGLAMVAQGQLDDAIADMRALVADHPNYTHARFNLAVFLYAKEDLQAARAEAEKVLQLRDTHWYAWRLLARIEAREGHGEAAIAAYLRALAVEPRDDKAAQELAEELTKAGRAEDILRFRAIAE